MLVSSPGGRCWFGVELKTFEISIEEHKGKVHGKICERGPKFCSSIRFGGKCLSLLLEGVESCCGLKKRTPFRKFCLGVSPLQWKGALLENHTPAQAFPSSSVNKDFSSLRDCPVPRDAVWIEVEKETLDRNEELLGRCLVGFWEGDSDRFPNLASFRLWAKNSWFLEGNLWLSNVRENLLLLEFEFADEAKRVYNSGTRRFRGRSFCLEKWKPFVGCFEGAFSLSPIEVLNPQGTLYLPLISPRRKSSSSTPFWDTRLERERGSCPGLLESTLREMEATPMKDGSTVVLNSDLEKDLAKQRDLLAAPPCVEGWSEEELSKLFHFNKVLGMPVEGHEVEILALLKKLKLRTGNNTLSKRRKKKKSCTTRFERELKRLECSVSYGRILGITKKSGQSSRKANQGSGEESKPDLVCLLETNVKEMSLQMVKSVGVGRFLNWASMDAKGAAGGLILFWDNRVLENLEVESGGIPSLFDLETTLMASLGFSLEWDFNSVRFPEKRRNAPSLTAEMRRFSKVIGSWEDHFSAITQSTLPHMVFDHSPIVLKAGGFSSGKSPFCFENMWLKIDCFKDLVRSWWNGYSNKEVVSNVSSNREAFSAAVLGSQGE
ncbi:hypothetical protein AAG906_017992 [Vitis piasezkii]